MPDIVLSLDRPSFRPYYSYSMVNTIALAEAIERTPGSIRELAREAGRSEALLRHVRDGRRRLTGETRAAVVSALRRWADRCEEAAAALDGSAAPEPRKGRMDGCAT